jgi:outer membrane protein
MNRVQVFLWGGMMLLIVSLAIFFYLKFPKTAYVNTEVLYNDFILKKELEQKLKTNQDSKNAILDSLGQELQILSEELEVKRIKEGEKVNRFNVFRRNYMIKKEEFEKQNEELSAKYSEQIWKQLNQFIKEYGDKNSYDYIYGVHGQGNLMYANESENITSQLKEYVNSKYEGDIK